MTGKQCRDWGQGIGRVFNSYTLDYSSTLFPAFCNMHACIEFTERTNLNCKNDSACASTCIKWTYNETNRPLVWQVRERVGFELSNEKVVWSVHHCMPQLLCVGIITSLHRNGITKSTTMCYICRRKIEFRQIAKLCVFALIYSVSWVLCGIYFVPLISDSELLNTWE